MEIETFQSTKKKFKKAFAEILSTINNYEIDEAALPAYAHKNPLIDYLFWSRLSIAFEFAKKQTGNKKALDFGCGSGCFSYLLAKNGYQVTATDLDFSPLKLVQEKLEFPSNIKFIQGDIIDKELPDNSFDVIFALDVLEHIENLSDYVELFKKLLTPDGVIIISGPTENILYKIGRKFAGNRFTGDYHVTNISSIKKEFGQQLNVKTIKKLISPFVLFELFSAHKVEKIK
jgi:2-polyprenyl-3-methyl-5-hydroxy-6-metoxy-1,4-benzoquinol methylase|tara:strand:- start:2 stop:694 length:693 start_codon:yes stop_codon:yes gene_type:complete